MAGEQASALGSDIVVAAVVTGVAALLAVAALVLLFIAGGPFGTVNDILNAVIGLASAVLAIVVHRAFGGSALVTGLAVAGALVTVLGSWLVLSGTTGFQFAGFVSGIGFALIGAWLLASILSGAFGASMPDLVSRVGMVAGAVMVVGAIAVVGVAMRIDSAADTPWWLWFYGVGWLGTYVLYPAWCLLLARAR